MAPSRGRSRAACTAARSCKRMHKCYVRTLELSTKNVDCQVFFRGAFAKCLDGHAGLHPLVDTDRKSTRLNSSHLVISYAVFCLKKNKQDDRTWGFAWPPFRQRVGRPTRVVS